MHKQLQNLIIEACRKRRLEGDCTVTETASKEQLEEIIIQLADELEQSQQAVPDEVVSLPVKAALAIMNALDEAIDGLLAASVDRQPTRLGRDKQSDRLATVRGARHVFEIAMNWKNRTAAPAYNGKKEG